MTLPAQKIQMPAMPAPTPGEKHTRLTKPETQILLTTGSPYTRVFVALVSTKYLTRFESRYLGVADLMTMCELSPSSVYAALKTLTAEGRCHQLEGRYGYIEVRGPRLSTPRPISNRGRYERKDGKGARKSKGEQTPEVQAPQEEITPDSLHSYVHNPVHNYGRTYGEFGLENAVQDNEKAPPKELRINIIDISTTTSTDTREEKTQQANTASAEASEVVVVVSPAAPEQHPPVGGVAGATGLGTAAPVQEHQDTGTSGEENTDFDNENVPPTCLVPAAHRPRAAAPTAADPLGAAWEAAENAIEGAGLSGLWKRWQAHVRGSTSQQLAQAEQWAAWIEAGLAESLRLQVPETMADTEVRSPFRHLAASLRNRAEEAQHAKAAAGRQDVHAEAAAAFIAGQRIQLAGHEMTIIEVAAKGLITDHPDYAMIPAAYLSRVQLVGGAQ